MPFTGSSGSGLLPVGGRNANSELEKLAAAASEADEERETADTITAATIYHGTLIITLGGDAIVIQLAALQAILAEDSPLQPLLEAAQNLARLEINPDGTIAKIAKLDAPEQDEEEEDRDGAASDSNRGEEDQGMGAPQPGEHLDKNEEDRDDAASDSNRGGNGDEEGMGAPQLSHHVDDEGAAVSGASSPAPEEVA